MLRTKDTVITRLLAFQTKYRKYCEHSTMLRRRSLLVKCAWCKRHMGWKRKEGAVPFETSHGICPRCAADVLSKLPTATSLEPQEVVPDKQETDASPTPPAA